MQSNQQNNSKKHLLRWLAAGIFIGLLAMCRPGEQAAPSTSSQPIQTPLETISPAVLAANGTVLPIRQITLRTETSGQITAVNVRVGDTVQTGQTLARLDPAEAERTTAQAAAALQEAETHYQLVAAGPTAPERQAARCAAELELLTAQQALDALYAQAGLAAAQALQNLVFQEESVRTAERRLNNLAFSADPALIDAAQAEMILAEDVLHKAEEAYRPWRNKPESNVNRANHLAALAAARQGYDAAVRKYNSLSGTAAQHEIRQAEAALALAQAQLAAAQETYAALRRGPDPEALALAAARKANAQAALELAEAAGPTPEQLDLAAAQLNTARVNLATAQAQITKTLITAPFTGVVAAITIQTGEWVAPNEAVIELMDISQWMIETKNISELVVNQLAPGQPVQVRISAFQEPVLDGTIAMISPLAVIQQGDITYTLYIALQPTDLPLRAGMTARVQIIPGTRSN